MHILLFGENLFFTVHAHRPDPFENRVPSIDSDEDLGSESELHDDQESGVVQAPPIKLAMWVSIGCFVKGFYSRGTIDSMD